MTNPHDDSGRRGSWEWSACGASVTGSQHVSRGLGCDDAFAYSHIGDFIVAAVADGAGSVSGTSAWGSYTACQAVLDLTVKPAFLDGFKTATTDDADVTMRWLFSRVRERVDKQAAQMGLPVGLLATTLSVAIANRDLLVLGQIGDGIIASESDDGIATHLIEEKDEYANTTWFIHTDEAFEKSFRAMARTGATAFALSTDGMSYKITDIVTGEPFEPFFKGAWQRVRSGAAASDFAALLRGIEDDQTGDDKTMVLAALNWVEDAYHPSARPVFRADVSSPPPPLAQPPSAPRDTAAPEEPTPVRGEETTTPLPALPSANGELPTLDQELPAVPPAPPVGADAESPPGKRRRWRKARGGSELDTSEPRSLR